MKFYAFAVVVAVAVTVAVAVAADDSDESQFDDCFRSDSITCLQNEMYRQAKQFFERDRIELFGGLALTKKPASRELKMDKMDKQMENVEGVGAKEEALEQFAFSRIGRLLEERSLSWNLSPVVDDLASASRSLADSIPQELKNGVSQFMEEGRGKKKKLMKALLPFLIGIKMKLAGFMVLAYFVIALIAKKALLASIISLAIAGFVALKKMMTQQHQGHEVHEVPHGWSGGYSAGGWDSYGGAGDAHGAYSAPAAAHSLAYGAQKPASMR